MYRRLTKDKLIEHIDEHKNKASESDCEVKVTRNKLTATQSTIATVKAQLNMAQKDNAAKDATIKGLVKEKLSNCDKIRQLDSEMKILENKINEHSVQYRSS